MSYLAPSEFVTKMVDAGESKVFMSTRDTLIRAFMAGAILALAAVFAVTIVAADRRAHLGAILFPVGFVMLYLLGFDLVTGVFVLAPLALIDKRPGVTLGGVLRNWGLIFVGNFAGAFTVAVLMSVIFTFGFDAGADAVGQTIAHVGESRTLGYKEHGMAGMLTLFVRAHALQLDGVDRRGRRDDLHLGQRQGDRHVDAHHGVLLHDVRAFRGEHVPVPLRHSHGRQIQLGRLLPLERDPHHRGQHGRRPGLHRPDPVLDAREDRAQAAARSLQPDAH